MKKLLRIIAILFGSNKKEKTFESALPVIFDNIDSELPALIGIVSGHEIEKLINTTISKATGSEATADQLKTVVRLYSPIKAAFKAFNA